MILGTSITKLIVILANNVLPNAKNVNFLKLIAQYVAVHLEIIQLCHNASVYSAIMKINKTIIVQTASNVRVNV